jgi:hypothetical protein
MGVAALCAVLSAGAFYVMSRADLPAPTALEAVTKKGPPEQMVLVFVDSLRDDIARDATMMPNLVRLSTTGGHAATFNVEPCRDRLTYLCLRAVATGRDESSLLSVAQNFRQEREANAETVFDVLKARGERIVAIGSHDLARYESGFRSYRPIEADDETPESILEGWPLDGPNPPKMVLVGLMRGDSQSHVHRFGTPEYRDAWIRIDDIIGAIAARTPPETHLMIFGDHGHDEIGRHLPGLEVPTWALYRGPAIRGATAPRTIEITDHRALLGVLLGVDSPKTYAGPALAEIFEPEWLAREYSASLPVLTGNAPPALPTSSRLMILAGLVLVAGLLSWRLGFGAMGFGLAVWAAATGVWFDDVRKVIHDHGDTPARVLYVLGPLIAASAVALLPIGARRRVLLLGGLCLLPLWLLFPSANFYGSGRAVDFGAALALLPALWLYRRELGGVRRWAADAALTVGLLITFLDVSRQDVGAMSTYDFSSPVYSAWSVGSVPVLLAILIGKQMTDERPLRRWVLSALAAAVVGAMSYYGVLTHPVGGVAVPLGLVSLVFWRRAPALAIAGCTAAMLALYEPSRVAGILGLITACFAGTRLIDRLVAGGAVPATARVIPFALCAYLLLWPMVGFRISGVDFVFMFRWVSAQNYEQYWWVFIIATVIKLALPYWLLLAVTRTWAADLTSLPVLPAKALLVSVYGIGYAVERKFVSRFSLDVLSEVGALALVCVVVVVAASLAPKSPHETSPAPR